MLIKENGVDVDCGECNGCCTSSYFIHITGFEVFKTVEFTLDAYEAAEDGGDVIIIDEGEEPPEFLSVSASVIIYPQEDTVETVDFTNDRAPVPGELVLIDDNNIKMAVTWFG